MTDPTAAPTVALVHGAFADSSSWNDVIRQLQAVGVKVRAVAIPLRGIATDTAYLASALRQIPGRVLAVGHSYGGAIITNAARHSLTDPADDIRSAGPPDPRNLGGAHVCHARRASRRYGRPALPR